MIPNQTYYIEIKTGIVNFDYTLAVTTASHQDLPNTTCKTAIPLKINNNETCNEVNSITTNGATDEIFRDVWNSFVAEQPRYSFELKNIKQIAGFAPEEGQFYLSFYEHCNSPTFKREIAVFQETYNLESLTIRKTYFINVASSYNQLHSFDLCVRINL